MKYWKVFYTLHVTGAFLCSLLIYFQYQFAIKRRHSHLGVFVKKEIRIWVEMWVNREHRPMEFYILDVLDKT